jgi:hypothetical protein
VLEVLDEILPLDRQSGKAADTDRQSSRRPGIDKRDDPDGRGSFVSAGCCCRNNRDANAAADHMAERLETGKPESQFQVTAGADRVVFHLILQGIAGREADMVIAKGIAERYRPPPAHRMVSRRDQHEMILGKRKSLQFFGGIDLVAGDADFGGISSDGAHDVAAGMLLKIDIDLGMLQQEGRQAGRQKLSGCRRIGE